MVVDCIESVRMIWDRGLSQALPTMIASSEMDHFRLFVRAPHIEQSGKPQQPVLPLQSTSIVFPRWIHATRRVARK